MTDFAPELVERAAEAHRDLIIRWGRGEANCDHEDVALAVLSAVADPLRAEGAVEFVDLLFTVPPGPDSQFVEAEDPQGRGVRVGEWIPPSDDQFWRLRIPRSDAYQRGMVEGARQVREAVETEAEKFDLYTNIAEKVADAAREAVARIEKGGE